MRRSRSVVGAAVFVLILLSLVPAAATAAAPTVRDVSFTIDADSCSDITSDVTASGVWREVTSTRVSPDGQTYVVYNATATGTAVDEDGVTYRFNYHNHRSFVLPTDGSPYQVTMSDHFNLVGAGGVNDIHAGFSVLITFAPDGTGLSFDMFINQRGYAGSGYPPCDPI